ncbi:MAG: 3-dehydroquinate synthase family protein, partial [Anaerovoracaceae bacterium]
LLAAVDSSVGGKTGINLSSGKNLAGAFWQPALVIFDQETLTTLQPTSILDGLAEMIKCAMIADKQLFDQLGQLNPKDLPKGLLPLIGKTVEIKQKLVEEDERDTGSRQLLNFGHTLGHAIELCSNYEISHGHGVAIGMKVFTSAAAARGYTTKDCKEQLIHLLTHFDF